MDRRPIGVFDSGLGGLTVVRRLQALLPGEDIVYFGDTGRVPYGTRSRQILQIYARQDSAFLLKKDVKMILAACGTVSSVAPEVLRELPVPAFGVVQPAAAAAARITQNGRIGILGTSATIRSGAFQSALHRLRPSLELYAKACPLFVPLVENGWIERDNEAAIAIARRYLRPLQEQRVDTVLLGCTHFPLLSGILADILGEGVHLVDSGAACAEFCAEELRRTQALGPQGREGRCSFFVSDWSDSFSSVARLFLGREVEGLVHRIDWEEHL